MLVTAELVVVALLVTSSVARAQAVQVVALAQTLDEVLNNIRNWLMGILGGIATVCFTVGGVRRIFGAGDPGEQEKAKDCFKAGAWGFGLAALAPLIVVVLKGIVGA